MPTQEERLTALEQKTAAHMQEIDENTTIMLGVMRHQGQDIKRIFQRLETMDESLSTLGLQLNQLDTRLNQLQTNFDEHTALLTQILERLS
ncbi:MAG TPA: hypothetical protein VFQ36_02300 [Ktedonobacteraceae bacterium]|nr:hypothetical protein [Ktedonobacteraceae bacterium]